MKPLFSGCFLFLVTGTLILAVSENPYSIVTGTLAGLTLLAYVEIKENELPKL
jgi:hypothetical protein